MIRIEACDVARCLDIEPALATTSRKLVEGRPELVQQFIDASLEGWYSYLYGDPAPGDKLIREANPEMPQDEIISRVLFGQGKQNLQAPWLGISAFAVLALMLSLLVFIGEAARDAFDPRK